MLAKLTCSSPVVVACLDFQQLNILERMLSTATLYSRLCRISKMCFMEDL